jgi:hypothetical protein
MNIIVGFFWNSGLVPCASATDSIGFPASKPKLKQALIIPAKIAIYPFFKGKFLDVGLPVPPVSSVLFQRACIPITAIRLQ